VWRVLKQMPDNWMPAIYRARPTASRFCLSVTFQMMDEAHFKRNKRPTEPRSRTGSAHGLFVTVVAIERGSQSFGPQHPAPITGFVA
jgi:hypothetical protein